MKRINLYILSLSMAAVTGLTSCNDFLDELPDNRMELNDAEDLSYLLVNAYPSCHPAAVFEWYSDNSNECVNTSWTGERFQEQAYYWQPINESSGYESPKYVWDNYYAAVENANHVIKFVEENGSEASYADQYGEALMLRAYSVFTLSTMFCQAYDPSTADQPNTGMPYPMKPQEYVGEIYERGTLAELYARVEADIEKALPLIGNNYAKPKYHFNKEASHAFAARFYLYYQKYDKAIEHATAALGSNPSAKLRDWQAWNALSANKMVQPNAYIASTEDANFMLQVVTSQWGVYIGPFLAGEKFTHNHRIADYETISADGPWGNSQEVFDYQVFYNDDMSSKMLRKIPYIFEYSDIQAGIGYPHSVYSVFNADETLLVRAEAKILKGDLLGGLDDINAELSKFSAKGVSLTQIQVDGFYNGINYYTPQAPTPKKELFPWFSLQKGSEQENMLQCLLQLRRLVTIHEGLRLQDVKRYGITMYRCRVNKSNQLLEVTDTMKKGDPRLAIQLPQEVIAVGLPANPR